MDILNTLKIRVDMYKIVMDLRSVPGCFESSLKKSVRITVAELFRLVETVLIQAAKIEAINKSVKPTGS